MKLWQLIWGGVHALCTRCEWLWLSTGLPWSQLCPAVVQLPGCPPCLLLPYLRTHSAHARPLHPSPGLWRLVKQLQFDFPSFFRVTSPRRKGGKKKSLVKPCFPPASEACGTIWLQDRPWALLSEVSTFITHTRTQTHTHTLSLPTVSDGQCFCPKVRTLVGIAGWAWMLT